MGARIRDFDWSSTPLGPLRDWPASLKTCVGLMLLSPVPMALLWGPEGRMLYNDGYRDVAGGRHPAMLGNRVLDAWPEPEAVAFNERVLRAGQRGASISVRDQFFVLHPDGVPKDIWFDLLYNPVLDEHGKPAGMLAIVIETSARVWEERRRQRAEAQLSVAQERIQLALDAGAVIGTWVWIIPQDVFTADARFARTFSLDAGALEVGLPLAEVVQSIHPEDAPRVEALLAEALRQGGPYRAEYRVRQLDGSWRWLEANGHCEHDAKGRPLRFLGVLLDIHQHRLERQRRDFLLALSDRLRPMSRPWEIMSASAEMLGRHLGIHRVGYAETDLTERTATFVRGLGGWQRAAPRGHLPARRLRAGERPRPAPGEERDLPGREARCAHGRGGPVRHPDARGGGRPARARASVALRPLPIAPGGAPVAARGGDADGGRRRAHLGGGGARPRRGGRA